MYEARGRMINKMSEGNFLPGLPDWKQGNRLQILDPSI